MKTLVVARYKEDCAWIADVDPEVRKIIVQKEVDCPNEGREPFSYLWFIVSHYNKLEGTYYFVQGNPFDHCSELKDKVHSLPVESFEWLGNDIFYLSDQTGNPHHSGIPVYGVYQELCGVSHDPPKSFRFPPGGQFAVTSHTIKKKPLSFYTKALWLCIAEKDNPWCFERLWERVFL